MTDRPTVPTILDPEQQFGPIEARQLAKAIRQRWPIPDDYKRALIQRCMTLIADPTTSARGVIAAAKAVISAEKQNQDDQHHESGTKLEISTTGAVVNAKETATLAMELVRKEPEYLAYLEQRAIEQDRQRQLDDRTIDARPRTE